MFVTMGIVASLAIAGYLGYRNKEQVIWNSVKIYDSIKDYCYQFQDKFKLDDIIIYNGCDEKMSNYVNSKIGISYILNGKKYCKLYDLFPDNKGGEDMTKDIKELRKLNKKKGNLQENRSNTHINYILSGTYFDGFEEIDVTDLLHMFDIDGKFYDNNKKITFNDMLKWCEKLNLSNIYEDKSYWTRKGNNKTIEIINLFGDIKSFMPEDILKFE
jgi:hypothetical protein